MAWVSGVDAVAGKENFAWMKREVEFIRRLTIRSAVAGKNNCDRPFLGSHGTWHRATGRSSRMSGAGRHGEAKSLLK